MIDLKPTIIAKSDQLNANDLVGGPRIIKITNVTKVNNPQQPTIINYEGDDGRPYKPNIGMRRGLVLAWGADGEKYIGKSLKVYCNPTVFYKTDQTGGIQILEASHIEKPVNFNLLVRRKVVPYVIKVLKTDEEIAKEKPLADEAFEDWKIKIDDAKNMAELSVVSGEIKGADYNESGRDKLMTHYKEAVERLRK